MIARRTGGPRRIRVARRAEVARPTGVARRIAVVAASTALLAALAGCATAPAAEDAPAAPAPGAAGGLQDPVPMSSPPPVGEVTAVRVELPSIGVSSDLEQLALDPKGELLPPVDFDLAGWYAGGVVPGGVGPAIIAGHVDSAVGPAVFARLDELVPGDRVLVTLSDGRVVEFEITGSLQSAKATFPTSDVYGNVPTPQLRLITCSGAFDRSTGHYVDNLIVFADLVS